MDPLVFHFLGWEKASEEMQETLPSEMSQAHKLRQVEGNTEKAE
jgi:hypothetical protein